MTDVEMRFWDKVRIGDGCWEWQASKRATGYGQFAYLGKPSVKAHRVAWMLNRGLIPDGVCVLHRCDNPGCVRPSHLFLGTQEDNIRDREVKGRSPTGDAHWSRGPLKHRVQRGDNHWTRRGKVRQ
jgi:hypothetical protein